jgi:hypothetical protein
MLTRRSFFKMLGFSGLLSFRRPKAEEPGPRSIGLLEVYVAGFQYHTGMRPEVFHDLEIACEPENPHDELAIAVRTRDGHKLGYIPRSCNEVPAAIADQSIPLRAGIIELDADAPPWEPLAIRVWQGV